MPRAEPAAMKEFLIPAVIAVIIAIAFFLGVFGSVSTPSGDNPAVVRAADFATPTAGCGRACCQFDGSDCVKSLAPCANRTDGRTAMKRFVPSGDACPNPDGTGGWVAPPEGYRQFETRYCDNSNPKVEGTRCLW